MMGTPESNRGRRSKYRGDTHSRKWRDKIDPKNQEKAEFPRERKLRKEVTFLLSAFFVSGTFTDLI